MTCLIPRRTGPLCARACLTMLLLLLATSLWAEPPRKFEGPFRYWDGITFYVVNPRNEPFRLTLESNKTPMLVRVFDPQETLLTRHGFPYNKEDGNARPIGTWTFDVPAKGAGVYMVVVNGHKGVVRFSTDPGLSFGVYGHVNLLVGTGNQYDDAYVYLPPGLEALPVKAWRSDLDLLTVRDETGKTRLRLIGKDPKGRIENLPKEPGRVWRLSVQSKTTYHLDFDLLPIILCPDADTARAIHAGIDVLEDGTICYHKFQVDIQRILERYRAMDRTAFDVPDYKPEDHREVLLRQSERNRMLFGRYGVLAVLPIVLFEQNLDPESPWFGSTWQWHDGKGIEKKHNPMATYMRLPGRYQQMAWFANDMAAVYHLEAPFNPLHKDKALLNRVIIASLQNMMLLKEGEFFSPKGISYHYGTHAFWLKFVTPAFEWAAADCPEDVRRVWTEAMTRAADRMSMLQVASTSNQWTFGMAAFQSMHEGTGDKRWHDIVDRHIDWLVNRRFNYGLMPAGYMTEGGGPDSTYNGLTGVHLAEIYNHNPDPRILKALDRAYTLFNHTVVPQPGGHWQGASSFCCRTPGTWTGAQGGGGHNMMGDDLASSGLWMGRAWLYYPVPQQDKAAEALREIRRREFPRHFQVYAPDTLRRQPEHRRRTENAYGKYTEWRYYASTPKTAPLPAVAEQQFTRNFGDEFFALRRKRWYGLIYTGVTWPRWRGEADDLNKQFPTNGDLCLFWSPGFGTSVLGRNYSAYSAMSLVARRGNTTVRDDYFELKHTWQDDPAELTVTGKMQELPVRFARRYRVDDDALRVELTVEADKPVTLESFVECFPFGPTRPPITGRQSMIDKLVEVVDLPDEPGRPDKPVPMVVTPVDAAGAPVERGPAEAVVFSVKGLEEVHVLVFDEPRPVDVGLHHSVDAYKNKRTWGRVLAALPRRLVPDQPQTCRWALAPTKGDELEQAIRSLRARLVNR